MIGLCIGTGEWSGVAARAAARMQLMTGIECHVISHVPPSLTHASWHKLNLLNYFTERLLIFDADIWCTREWDVGDYLETGLAMVPEPQHRSLALECDLYHVPRTAYCNAGLMIVDHRAKEVFAETMKLHPRYGSWLEQTALNHVIHARHFPLQQMPRALNTLVEPGLPLAEIRQQTATNLHFAGPKTLPRLHEIFDAMEDQES